MKKILFLGFSILISTAFAEGPIFHHDATFSQQEFENVYKDLRSNKSTSKVIGIIDGSVGSPGFIGQYVSSRTAANTAFPSSSQYGDLVSTSIAAGDWILSCVGYSSLNGATVTDFQYAITTVAGNSIAGITVPDNFISASAPTTTADANFSIADYHVSITATTTYYLKYFAEFSAGTPKAAGRLSAHRIR